MGVNIFFSDGSENCYMEFHVSGPSYDYVELLAGPIRIHNTSCLTFNYMILSDPFEHLSYAYLGYGLVGTDGFFSFFGFGPDNPKDHLGEWQAVNMSLNAAGLFRPLFHAEGRDATVRLDNVRLQQTDCITTGRSTWVNTHLQR